MKQKRLGRSTCCFFFLDRVACCATSTLPSRSTPTSPFIIPRRANCLQFVGTFQIMSSRFLPGSSNTLLGVILAAGIGTIVLEWVLIRPFRSKRRADERHPRFRRGHTDNLETNVVANNLTQLIGNTPLLRINCLSDLTGIEIWAKCEFLNPGGSIKDRIALQSLSPFQTKQNKNSHTHWIKAVIDWFDDALIHPLTLNIGLNK